MQIFSIQQNLQRLETLIQPYLNENPIIPSDFSLMKTYITQEA